MKTINGKTQINSLVNGSSKLPNATVGTPYDERMAIAQQVHSENPEYLLVRIGQDEIILTENHSISGKSWFWMATIPADVYYRCGGDMRHISTDAKRNEYSIIVNGDCTVELCHVVRKPGKQNTAHRTLLRESYVTIL